MPIDVGKNDLRRFKSHPPSIRFSSTIKMKHMCANGKYGIHRVQCTNAIKLIDRIANKPKEKRKEKKINK